VIHTAADRTLSAGELILSAAAHVGLPWLAAGVALHLLAQVVRIRGWWQILGAAYSSGRSLRVRHVAAAYFAGAGLNGVLPARAGDLVKLAFLKRRIRGSRYATLAATSVPETAFETVCGAALVGWMLARGFMPIPVVAGEVPAPDVSWYLTHPIRAWLSTAIVLWAALMIAAGMRRRSRALADQLRRGLAIFSSPRRYVLHVVTWQTLGRVIRLGSLACFLAAFALPATPRTALLVMAAQGGGRIIPIAPVSAGLRIALLSYGLVEVSGQPIDPAAVTAFTFGVSATLFSIMLAISLVLVGRELQTRSPWTALRRARARMRAAEPTRSVRLTPRHSWRSSSRRGSWPVPLRARCSPHGMRPTEGASCDGCRAPPEVTATRRARVVTAGIPASAKRPRTKGDNGGHHAARAPSRGAHDGARLEHRPLRLHADGVVARPSSCTHVARRPWATSSSSLPAWSADRPSSGSSPGGHPRRKCQRRQMSGSPRASSMP
jgi:hypothetical protein